MTNVKLKWSVSGLCVTARPEDLTAVAGLVSGLPDVEVHGSDPGNGRLVVVQEAASIKAHQDRLREIQGLPGVLTADLVVHYQDPEDCRQQRQQEERNG